MRRTLLGLLLLGPLFAVVPAGPAAAAGWEPGPALYDVAVTESDVPVTMADGRVLRAAVHRPVLPGTTTPADGPFPVILVQTPYGKSVGNTGIGAVNPYLIERGYIGVIVDVAGTGGSEGTSQLFGRQEAEDGAELVEWAARLPGSTGEVGLLGGSYLGIDQLFTAAAVGPGSPLKAILPIVSASDPYRDLFVAGGVVNMVSSLGLIAAYFGLRTLTPAAERPTVPVDALRLSLEHGLAGIPFELQTGLDVLAQTGRVYDSAYWQERAPQRVLQQIVDNDVPTFLVGGQYDVFQRGEPLLFSGLQNASVGRSVWEPMSADQPVDPRFHLLTGPWDHGNPGGEDLDEIQLRWFDQWLKDVDTGVLGTGPLHVVDSTAGAFEADRFPLAEATPTAYHLHPGGVLSTELPSANHGSRTLSYSPISLACRRSLQQWTAGLLREVYRACSSAPPPALLQLGDASFDTAPLGEPLQIAGPIGLRLQAKSTRPEAIFVATLQSVAPDGTVTDLTAGALLGSARAIDPARSWPGAAGTYQLPYHPHTREAEQPIVPGRLTRFDVELRSAFTTVPAGHRLRLVLGTADTHLLPPPLKLLDLLLGFYGVQTNRVTPSVLSLPVVD
ncbi:hydrolase CocE/NonD family protein [Aeromicrobium marinum DSM 15272]|uniref:Hydrolase CocE/NonD family protein n=1 Tax=Aeromicrobium marinum DSM 15272 TaxID=585531 RepID=E2SFW9_9ACTN|nr:CocE/NonD family hydrolase [Aeromicrobium marinum]EFQ81916.1 hydrolase CocE/NonD family protein [Aeromicrobium marinum DSM 15272]